MGVIRSSLAPKSLLKTSFFNKKISSPWKKIAKSISYYWIWQTSINTSLGYTTSFGNHCTSQRILSFGYKRLLKTHGFEKKAILSMEKSLGQSFPVLWSLTNLREKVRGVHKYCEKYFARYGIISLGPRRLLKTQFFGKKAILPVKKIQLTNFTCIFELDKPQGTFDRGPQGLLKTILQAITLFFWGTHKSITKFYKTKAIVPKKVTSLPILFHTHYARHRITISYTPQGSLAIMVQVTRSFFQHPRSSWKQIFPKKAIFPMKILACLFSFYRVWQTSGNILLGSKIQTGNLCASY